MLAIQVDVKKRRRSCESLWRRSTGQTFRIDPGNSRLSSTSRHTDACYRDGTMQKVGEFIEVALGEVIQEAIA